MGVILEARGLTFSYPMEEKNAIENIDIKINKGEKMAVLGANGSGKSTFFLCLVGINKPKSGALLLDNTEVSYDRKGLKHLRSKVQIVFQDPDNQLLLSSVEDEIAFGALNIGLENVSDKVDNIIKKLDMNEFRDRPVHTLSGGQKKQVAIADILVMEPEVIILDEPSAALDPRHTNIVRKRVDDMSKTGITVIVSTHDVDYAYGFADRIAVFDDGSIIRVDKPENIFTDEGLLKRTNLKKPYILEFYEILKKRGLIDDERVPGSMDELRKILCI